MDRVLLSSEQSGGPASRVVRILIPGKDQSTVDFAPIFKGQELLDTRWVIAGGKNLSLVIAARIRIPADGLTPESFSLELVAVDLSGDVINRTAVAAGSTSALEFNELVGSRSDVVAFSIAGDAADPGVKGIDVRSGKVSWTFAGWAVAPTYGTITVLTDLPGVTREGRSCEAATGYDIASGKALWAVDSTAEELDEGRCRGLSIEASGGWGTSYDDVASHGAMVTVKVGDPYTGGSVGSKVFEAATGKKLTMLSDRVDLYDPVQRLAYLDNSPSAWIGPRYEDGVGVYDTRTGSTLFELDADTANRLEFDAEQLFDGILYGETTDGKVVIAVATGKVISKEWSYYPVARVGDWTFYSDGVLSPVARPIR
jgi:hypothetical protein